MILGTHPCNNLGWTLEEQGKFGETEVKGQPGMTGKRSYKNQSPKVGASEMD